MEYRDMLCFRGHDEEMPSYGVKLVIMCKLPSESYYVNFLGKFHVDHYSPENSTQRVIKTQISVLRIFIHSFISLMFQGVHYTVTIYFKVGHDLTNSS